MEKLFDIHIDIISALMEEAEERMGKGNGYPYLLGVVSNLLTEEQWQTLATRLRG